MSPRTENEDSPATNGEPTGGPSSSSATAGGGFHQFLQPNRDLQSNWEVDLARNLEEYLFKICSGEIAAGHDHEFPHPSVNFAEAALLLQGSVQVYSRKVEYLYSLVLHALDFLSQKRQNENEKTSMQPNEGETGAVVDEDNEAFLGLDDVPVEAKNSLDPSVDKGENSRHVLHPPANLLVLEGDCLATNGDGSELDSYLLATCDFFEDFLLLDPCDAEAVHDLKAKTAGKEGTAHCRSNSVRSKTHRSSLQSPDLRPIGSGRKSSIGKNLNLDKPFESDCPISTDNIHCSGSQNECDYPDHETRNVDDQDIGCSYNGDESDDDDDPWKPLNPYEPGNLKIKPYRKVKSFARHAVQHRKRNSLASQFPIAKLDSIVSPELNKLFEVQKIRLQEKLRAPQSPPLFEKLRRELSSGEQETGGFVDMGGDHDHDHEAEFEAPDFSPDLPDDAYNMDAEVPLYDGKLRDNLNVAEDVDHDNLDTVGNLEDLCRSHLDALLASIAESEKQTELAARVSTWQQGVECAFEEEDKQPPFDIHIYGERILDTLSLGVGGPGGSMSFTDVVTGQTKQNVARTFSALLQLVNNGKVDLDRNTTGSELVCHTSENPFYVRFLSHDIRVEEINNGSASARKRSKSITREGCKKSDAKKLTLISPSRSSLRNGSLTVKLMKGSITRCTPEGKRRRRSVRPTEPFDLQSAI